jgi:hypothetical protein
MQNFDICSEIDRKLTAINMQLFFFARYENYKAPVWFYLYIGESGVGWDRGWMG